VKQATENFGLPEVARVNSRNNWIERDSNTKPLGGENKEKPMFKSVFTITDAQLKTVVQSPRTINFNFDSSILLNRNNNYTRQMKEYMIKCSIEKEEKFQKKVHKTKETTPKGDPEPQQIVRGKKFKPRNKSKTKPQTKKVKLH